MTGNTQARKIASPDGMAGRGEIPFTTGPIVRLGSSICVTRISIRLQNPCYEAVLVRRTEDRTIIDVKDQAGFLSVQKRRCALRGKRLNGSDPGQARGEIKEYNADIASIQQLSPPIIAKMTYCERVLKREQQSISLHR
jgi:hypothetical protein